MQCLSFTPQCVIIADKTPVDSVACLQKISATGFGRYMPKKYRESPLLKFSVFVLPIRE